MQPKAPAGHLRGVRRGFRRENEALNSLNYGKTSFFCTFNPDTRRSCAASTEKNKRRTATQRSDYFLYLSPEDMEHVLDKEKMPQHIAIIMDGNGRWAKKKGQQRFFGHRKAMKSIRETLEACGHWGIKYLTLYGFSTENWNRPRLEVNAIMQVITQALQNEQKNLMKNNVRLHVIGDPTRLPKNCQRELQSVMEATANNTALHFTLALSYSGRWEITQAVRNIAQQVKEGKLEPEDINETVLSQYLSTAEHPDPELMIRTSGESRLSNFLLWQLAYAELFFTPVLWPDFRREHLEEALLSYQQRERRFGKTGEQLAEGQQVSSKVIS